MVKLVCKNPWCKAPFNFDETKHKQKLFQKKYPDVCFKCQSFANETSGGVIWEDKHYDGPRGGSLGDNFRYVEGHGRK